MKNSFIIKFISKVKINIKGKNIERFIKRLKTNNIEMLKIKYIKHNNVDIIIYKKDYEKVLELKSVYDVSTVDNYGIIKLRKVINIYKYVLFSLGFSIFLLIFLSNIIFNVKVIHTDSEVRNFILDEVSQYGIKKYKFKKSFNEIQNIKEQILDKYKDKIEWLEIENVGTSYIIRLQNRIIPDNTIDYTNQNVVAKKSAIIKKIIAEKGVVVKELNTYVNKDEIIISGNIYLNEELKELTRADGVVFGEVWYTVSVEYPYIYSEVKETGNTKDVYVLKILNKYFELTTDKYKDKLFKDKIILNNKLLPISLVKQHQKEIVTISQVLTHEQAKDKALEEAVNKMKQKLKDDEYIIDHQILSTNIEEDKVILNVFFTVYENITSYSKIEGE